VRSAGGFLGVLTHPQLFVLPLMRLWYRMSFAFPQSHRQLKILLRCPLASVTGSSSVSTVSIPKRRPIMSFFIGDTSLFLVSLGKGRGRRRPLCHDKTVAKWQSRAMLSLFYRVLACNKLALHDWIPLNFIAEGFHIRIVDVHKIFYDAIT
jgi:hypothetical protein